MTAIDIECTFFVTSNISFVNFPLIWRIDARYGNRHFPVLNPSRNFSFLFFGFANVKVLRPLNAQRPFSWLLAEVSAWKWKLNLVQLNLPKFKLSGKYSIFLFNWNKCMKFVSFKSMFFNRWVVTIKISVLVVKYGSLKCVSLSFVRWQFKPLA